MHAYRLGLTFPQKFAGVISLNGTMPRTGTPRLQLPDVRQLRIFIGHGIANAIVPLSLARADQRLFYAAGMPVTCLPIRPTTGSIPTCCAT